MLDCLVLEEAKKFASKDAKKFVLKEVKKFDSKDAKSFYSKDAKNFALKKSFRSNKTPKKSNKFSFMHAHAYTLSL